MGSASGARRFRLCASGRSLECEWIGPPPEAAPTLVFLHEGLGCRVLWRDVPRALARATGCGALVYSRAGYGGSDPVALPRPLDYMEREGEDTLPELLAAAGVRETVLVGHSDGASIAIAYAGSAPRAGLRALVLEAPHVFCEDLSVRSIAKARAAFETGDLRARLARHHGANVDVAFWGWNRAWLDPGFRAWNLERTLPALAVPTLVIQGRADPYGTARQVEAIAAQAGGPVEILWLDRCGHTPHRERRAATLGAITAFVERILGA